MEDTDKGIPVGVAADPSHGYEQGRRTSEHGSVFESEDDLFLGTDAQAFSGSRPSTLSPGSSSVSTGFHYESSESTGNPGSHRVIKKLAHVGRLESSDSLTSDFSDFSRTSHDVSSLLNAMTVDPEAFLTDLGFAEPDMRTRIPDRFLESPSNARGIDVEFFKRSLDQDDHYGSLSQDSPVWSDPGISRIPLRFLTSHTEPINTVLSGADSSVPLISEPEEAPEDSFDLMRHLRLNKPCHVTKGMFLEPVTEELEVSSVGSGSVRTKISRKLSNEEGTIVREESLEQANVETELILDVPVMENVDTGLERNELKETEVAEQVERNSQIVVTVEGEEDTSFSHDEDVVIGNSVISGESNADNITNYNAEIYQCETSDHNKNDVSEDLPAIVDVAMTEVSPCLPIPAHLKVASIALQDSFELEEIANEDFNEKESFSSTDQEAGSNVKSSEKRLTRENSGESSGFEEMLPDKETLTPNSSSPTLALKRFSTDAHVIVSDSSRPLAALLDPEMLSFAADKVRARGKSAEENSPRATFAQRRTRSLTKQRPVDEDTVALWAFSTSSMAPNVSAAEDGNLGMKVSHDTSESFGPSFLSRHTKEPSIEFSNYSSNNYVDATDENCNTLFKSGPDEAALEKQDNSLENPEVAPVKSFEDELENNAELLSLEENANFAISQSESSSRLKSEITQGNQTNISKSRPDHGDSEHINPENVEYVHEQRDDNFLTNNGDNMSRLQPSVHFEEETQNLREVVAEGNSAPDELTEGVGACAEVKQKEKESQKAMRKVDFEYQQHYLHEVNVLEQSIQKYESTLHCGGPLDAVGASYYTKHMLTRITEEVNAIQELRLLIGSELDRMKRLLAERRDMLLSGATSDPVGSAVSQRMADLLREQSSLNVGLSNIRDELSIRKKASRRARIYSHIESAKKELKDEREQCMREFREEIKEALVRDLSEKFSSEIDLLRREVRSKDAIIEQLKKSQQQRDPAD